MSIINNLKYYIVFGLIIFVFLVFFPIPSNTEIIYNVTHYHSIIDWGAADYGFAAALIVGLIGLFGTLYTNDKNLNAMKMNSIREDYLLFITSLNHILFFDSIKSEFDEYDDIETFIQLLKLWVKNQTIMISINPELNKKLLYFFTEDIHFADKKDIPYENSQLLFNSIKTRFLDEIYNHELKSKVYNPKLCVDDNYLKDEDKTEELNISTEFIKLYIEKIEGERTKKISQGKFIELKKGIEEIIKDFDEEKERGLNF